MIEMRIQPHRMMLGQEITELIGYPEWINDGQSGANADDLNVRNSTQLFEDPRQLVVSKNQRVTAGEQNIPDFRPRCDIVDGGLEFVLFHHEGAIPNHPFSEAIAAVDRTFR